MPARLDSIKANIYVALTSGCFTAAKRGRWKESFLGWKMFLHIAVASQSGWAVFCSNGGGKAILEPLARPMRIGKKSAKADGMKRKFIFGTFLQRNFME